MWKPESATLVEEEWMPKSAILLEPEQLGLSVPLDKKSPQFKEFALSKEGSGIVAASTPEIAAKIAAKETPSRNDFKELGISGWSAEERNQLASLFRDALADQETKAIGIGLGPMGDEPGDTRTMKERLGAEPFDFDPGIWEISKAIREMVAPTTPYTKKESDKMAGELVKTLENIGVNVLTLGGLAGPLMGFKPSELRAAIREESEELAGFGPALTPAAGDTVLLAVEWGYLYPKLFAAVGTAGKQIAKIPKVAEGAKALKSLGGIEKVATKYPRTFDAATKGLAAFAKGATVGTIMAAPEALGEELPAGEVLRHISKRAALLGAVSAGFQLASTADTAIYAKRLRNALVRASNQRFTAKLAEVDAMPKSAAKSAAYKSLNSLKKVELQQIDNIVSSAEAQLIGLKTNKMYQQGQEMVETPQKAAERFIRQGIGSEKAYKGEPLLKRGLGQTKPFIEMPTTRAGEVRESLVEAAKAVRHPVEAARKAVARRLPKVGVPAIPKAVTPPPVKAKLSAEKRTQAIDYVKDVLSQEQFASLDEKAKIEIGQRMLAEQGLEVEAEELVVTPPTVPIPEPTEAAAAKKPAEGVEIPPKPAEAQPEAVGVAPEGKVAGMGYLLDDGTILKDMGAASHLTLATKIPKGKKVVDAGFIDKEGNYLMRDDVIKKGKTYAFVEPDGTVVQAKIIENDIEPENLMDGIKIQIPSGKYNIEREQLLKPIEEQFKVMLEQWETAKSMDERFGSDYAGPKPVLKVAQPVAKAEPKKMPPAEESWKYTEKEWLDMLEKEAGFREKPAKGWARNVYRDRIKEAIERGESVRPEVIKEFSNEKWAQEALKEAEPAKVPKSIADLKKLWPNMNFENQDGLIVPTYGIPEDFRRKWVGSAASTGGVRESAQRLHRELLKIEGLAEPTKVPEKEIKYEEEAITEPTPSPKVEPREARKIIPTGKLDPTNAKEALEITKRHTEWVAGGWKGHERNVWQGIFSGNEVEYTPEQIDTAYRTVQKPVESPMPDTDLFAMPGKEAQMKVIAQKMAKVKGVVRPKKKGRKGLTKPTALPKAKTKKEDHIKAVYAAASKEDTRYAINGVMVEGNILVATDGRRLFWAKGKWGKDGVYLDVKSLKKGSLGKLTKGKINFPKWRDIIPDVSDMKPIIVNLEAALSHVRQATIVTSEESKGITVIENKDERMGLGFAAAAPEVGHAEINVYSGGRILGALNPQYLLDVIKFHAIRGDTVIEFYFKAPDRVVLTKSFDGKTNTLTMPINVGEPSEAIKKAISEWPTKTEPTEELKSKGLKKKPAEKPETKRVISKEAYEKAKKRLTDNTTLRTGLDPQGMVDLLTIGAYHFETGIRKFADWSNKMIEEFGEKVRPHLQTVYDQVTAKRKPKKGTKARKEFEAETRERGFITSVKEEFPKMADKVAGQYIPRSTDKLSIKAKNLIKEDIDAAEELAKTGTNDSAVATASELIIHYNELAEATTDQAAEKTFYEKAANVAHPAAANLTELGRAVQAASILGRMTAEGQLRVAAKTINDYNAKVPKKLIGRKKIPQLTPEQTKEIMKSARAIEKMPDGEAKAKAFWEHQNYILELVPTPLWKKIINVWKAGLLTGIKTSGLNTFSNLAHGQSEILKDVIATGFDIMFSLFTKKRTIGLTVRGVPSGLKTGAARGWRYLKTGFDERNVAAKLDYHRVNMGKSKFAKAVGAYTDAIFRMMGAEDQPFYYGALARSLYSQAIAEAKNKELKGKEAKIFIENLVENPTDTMLNYAVQDALIAVYQNKTMLGKIGKKFQEMPVIGEVIAPFVRTPSAVAMQIINYSPVGVVKTAIENIGKGKFDQRLLSQGLARGLLGTGVLYLGTQLFVIGLMALGYPKGERERKLWEIEGRKPNSIKIGGKWRDVQVLGPVGPLLLIGGYFQQALESTGSLTEAMSTAMFGGAKSFSEQTFVRGVSVSAKAVADPERSWERFFSSLAGSTVPTIISDIARTIDTKERRSKGPIQRIQVRIPGLRQKLEPRIDVFGNDLPRYGGNALEVMLDPTRPFKINEDVVVDELRRLWDNEYKVSPTQLGYKYGYEFLTVEENTQMWYAVGSLTYERLHLLIRKPEYKRASDEEKAKAIERKVDKVKEQIKIRFRIKQRKEAFEQEAEK